MATIRDIVTAACRKARLAQLGEAVDPDIAAVALDEFNRMLHGWKLIGLDIGHRDQGLSGTFALPDEYQEGVVHLLAKRFEPNFALPAMFNADDFMRAIQAYAMEIDDVKFDTGLTDMPSSHLPGSGYVR